MSCYFWPILTPSPCHTLSRKGENTSHISDPPILVGLVQKPGQKPPIQILSQLFMGLFCLRGFVRGSFVWKVCPGWFLSVPLLSEYICYNRKLNITKFHVSYV